jgi:hypothetical protein
MWRWPELKNTKLFSINKIDAEKWWNSSLEKKIHLVALLMAVTNWCQNKIIVYDIVKNMSVVYHVIKYIMF